MRKNGTSIQHDDIRRGRHRWGTLLFPSSATARAASALGRTTRAEARGESSPSCLVVVKEDNDGEWPRCMRSGWRAPRGRGWRARGELTVTIR